MNKFAMNIKKLNDKATVPTYGSDFAAGADLYACEDAPVTIEPGQTKLVHTGLAMEIPTGLVGLIYARSGLASKKGLAPANKVGVIDSDYRGEMRVTLYNTTDLPYTVKCCDRIAQLMIVPVAHPTLRVVDKLPESARGVGGFGSTGR